MAALAELLTKLGADVSGSDVPESFYTEAALKRHKIPWYEGFSSDHLPEQVDGVIHSSAWSREENPELIEADRRGLHVVEYTVALGELSRIFNYSAVTGIHGKTTTTAMAGSLLKALSAEAIVLTGSGVADFGGDSTWVSPAYLADHAQSGTFNFTAETCEYKRHFLNMSPDQALITSIESDHLDYFINYEGVLKAFEEFTAKLPDRGTLVYCADDPGVLELIEKVKMNHSGLKLIPYGFKAEGDFKICECRQSAGVQTFRLQGFDEDFELYFPGLHNVLNAAGAAALVRESLVRPVSHQKFSRGLKAGFAAFKSTNRRGEIIGEAGNVLILDDYGHQPTAVRETLKGIKAFYPGRRLIVDFMSHTYSRTETLLTEFGTAFEAADVVILNKIYASAREKRGNIDGKVLAEEVRKNHSDVHYAPELDEAENLTASLVKPGDVFVTMGAGNNWQIGRGLLNRLKQMQ